MTEQTTEELTALLRIRSFVLRQGRMTEGQIKALDLYWKDYGLTLDQGLLDLSVVFGRVAPVVLEIGFGNGNSLVQMAAAQPEKDFIGIEVHRPGVGSIINEAQRQGVTNLRVFHEDAVDVLEQNIPDHSLAGFQLFFPDPWHKRRHHKRRLVQPEFIHFMAKKLCQNSFVHMATDWEHYAQQMMKVMTQANGFKNTQNKHDYAPRPEHRPLTRFERRGERLGHGVWDILFKKL